MSSAQVDRPTKVGHVNKKENDKSRKLFNQSYKKHKHDESRHFKFGRKRLQSFTGNGKFFPPYKRRKKEGAIIPPTKFLLGGNICDPLNLNSMQDEEINRAMNAVTPKSSPLPTPKHRKETIEVIIPPNICDPLNLSNCNDNDEYEKQLISPTKKGSKRRNRKRKRASSGSGKEDVNQSGSETDKITEQKTIEDVLPSLPSNEDVTVIKEVTSNESQGSIKPPSPPTPTLVVGTTPVVVAASVAAVTAVASPTVATVATVTTTIMPIVITQPTKDQKLESPQKDKNKLRLKGLDEAKDKRLRKVDVKDKIVSPVIPQPGAWKPRLPHRPTQDKKKKGPQTLQLPNFRIKNARFQYGNYDRYYGYRNPHHGIDPRLTIFAQRKELFFNKDILDIGCNIGHITLSIARDFTAHSVTGIDIDRKLIGIARRNIKQYVNCVRSPASNEDAGNVNTDCDTSFFPMSMPINYGPIDVPGFTKNNDHKGFPYNVTFVQGNYVLEDDSLLTSEQPQFDTILCLSITKWIHLNFGDAGLKQAFKRMHAQLRPGGVLVLEAQSWSSYGRKKALTERIYRTYHSIEFFPEKFTQYLLSSEVGFTKCEVVSIPPHPSKGFQRPIQLFTKAGTSPVPSTITRFVARAQEKKDSELRAFERDLFPREMQKPGNLSDLSQRSSESLSQYEQLENVYAPSTTPCYDTPSHNNDSQSAFEPERMCYVDVVTKTEVLQVNELKANDDVELSKTTVERKRKIEGPVIDVKKSRRISDLSSQNEQVNQVGITPNTSKDVNKETVSESKSKTNSSNDGPSTDKT
ncbi:probable RNA methyltransferase bin3 [Chelonus insularis]|uniref:probable RNA methyltransferase bin3 n=1 Tax=Chelonus insularis TaxID=460826 RepID=UPI001588982D|nr:probable RNA methyltransferase bin3 [Chelonus insularis]